MYDALAQYQIRLNSWSDIQAHLPRLYQEAHGIVLELGVRGGTSTSALLAGVVERGGHLYSVDINPHCWGAVGKHPQWTFINTNSLDEEAIHKAGVPHEIDLLFIDTVHTYEHTYKELEIWGKTVKSGGKILLHDIDDKDTYPGVRMAIINYCVATGLSFWLLPESNGLGIIQC